MDHPYANCANELPEPTHFEQLQALKKIAMDKSLSENCKTCNVQNIIDTLTPRQCFDILFQQIRAPYYYMPFIFDAAKYAECTYFIALLCSKIQRDQSPDSSLKARFSQLLQSCRHDEKTILYVAAENGNTLLVQYLRSGSFFEEVLIKPTSEQFYMDYHLDLDVNHAGPKEYPCAVNIAAKNGHTRTVIFLLDSKAVLPTKNLLGQYYGYREISRVVPDVKGQCVLHHLAKLDSPFTFWKVLNDYNTITSRQAYHRLTSTCDKDGMSPFAHIVNNPRAMEFIEYITGHLPNTWLGYLPLASFGWSDSWKLSDIFDFERRNQNGQTDLEYAQTKNPRLYTYLQNHLNKQPENTPAPLKLTLF